MFERYAGYSEDLLPFSCKFLSSNFAWETASKVLNEKISKKYEKMFEKQHSLYAHAMRLLNHKYEFYIKILGRDPVVMEQYSSKIGNVKLNERVAYSMHHCYIECDRLVDRLSKFIKNFPAMCLEKEETVYNFERPPASNCERLGVCICSGAKKPYMDSCVGDLTVLLRDAKKAKGLLVEGYSKMSIPFSKGRSVLTSK